MFSQILSFRDREKKIMNKARPTTCDLKMMQLRILSETFLFPTTAV